MRVEARFSHANWILKMTKKEEFFDFAGLGDAPVRGKSVLLSVAGTRGNSWLPPQHDPARKAVSVALEVRNGEWIWKTV